MTGCVSLTRIPSDQRSSYIRVLHVGWSIVADQGKQHFISISVLGGALHIRISLLHLFFHSVKQ